MGEYDTIPKISIGGINGHFNVPEISLSYKEGKKFSGRITEVKDVANFIRSLYDEGEIDLQEYLIVLYLNPQKEVKAYYRASKGGITSTIADPRLILGAALKCAATGIIVSHNHPSGNLSPSKSDLDLTEKIKKGAQFMDIALIEHLIITKDGFKSLAGIDSLELPGLHSLETANSFEEKIEQDLSAGIKHNKRSIEKLAATFGITDKTEIKELTELAIVNRARVLAHEPGTQHERFEKIVQLYESQVNISHRTSQSILLQQYSTPVPIGYLMGVFCGIDYENNNIYFEPSCGNGSLTIAGNPQNFVVNEIDVRRNKNLRTQGFFMVIRQDGCLSFNNYERKFDAILTNPPFGKAETAPYNGYPIRLLEHQMALRALDCMKDNGKAAIIIGGHTPWNDTGLIQAGNNRIFFNYLHCFYHVADVINIDGKKLYSRQGTSVDVRLILINGRKLIPKGFAPLYDEIKDKVVRSFSELSTRVFSHTKQPVMSSNNKKDFLRLRAYNLKNKLSKHQDDELGLPYVPASANPFILKTEVPDAMAYDMQAALETIKREVGGDIDNFVRDRLNYPTKSILYKALSAEQTDAAAIAIYNIEARGQAVIIADQTGIGKGRIAASIIRYSVLRGYRPVFITEKPNLFSDLYRDLAGINSDTLKPFIVNARSTKTNILDEQGEIIHEALHPLEQEQIIRSGTLPTEFDFVMATYSQFSSEKRGNGKMPFLSTIASDNIIILDESHNASGWSNTGRFLRSVVRSAAGVVFLSATFAKRPDNMPVYAAKTSIGDCNVDDESMIAAIEKGGVALQEVVSAQLVSEGQLVRRERSYENIEVNYITLSEKAEEHKAIADNITSVLRDIIAFQENHVNTEVKTLDAIAKNEGKEITERAGTSKAGVDNVPCYSKVFQLISQMLFSIKAQSVAEHTIRRLQRGLKPVIAFSSTMGSFLESMENEQGINVSEGDIINADFGEVLCRALDGVFRYTEISHEGTNIHKRFELKEFAPSAQAMYHEIMDRIKNISSGITISPIDLIKQKITEAGYRVAEVTGRKLYLELNAENGMGRVRNRKKENTNDAFRRFNNNEADVLMINQSGSTGASAHAITTAKVPAEQVKQRVMIVVQPELNINTEVQKRGRINRTGQIMPPIYDYVCSVIPAELRLMMLLQMKLKSLDANTSSNQKNSSKLLDVPDFLNEYGDKVVKEWLLDNPEINRLMDDPLNLTKKDGEDSGNPEHNQDAAHRVSGRVAVLSTAMQEQFYEEVKIRYEDYTGYLKQIGEYRLEMEVMNLQAETTTTRVIVMGKGGDSVFGQDSLLETVKVNNLKKPFSLNELQHILNDALQEKTANIIQKNQLNDFLTFMETQLGIQVDEIKVKYEVLLRDIPNEKRIQHIGKKHGADAIQKAMEERTDELLDERDAKINNATQKHGQWKHYMEKLLRFFYVGQFLQYPFTSLEQGKQIIPAVFTGFGIDNKRKNPYTPSSVKLNFALPNSIKHISIPASNSETILAIMGASSGEDQPDLRVVWPTLTQKSTADRVTRYIITGNLIQAFSNYSGKLISYTAKDKGERKGILMPEYWTPDEATEGYVVIPISRAVKIIRSLILGKSILTSTGLSLIKMHGEYKLITSAAKSKGGEIYLHPEILKLVYQNNFEKVSDKMTAVMGEENLPALIEILQRDFNTTVEIMEDQLYLADTKPLVYSSRKKIRLPEPEKQVNHDKAKLLRLKAKALQLKLKLLAA